MDPLTQATLGSAVAETVADRRRFPAVALAGAVAGLAPDLDVLIRSSTDPLLYLEYHRQFTHALIFIPFGAGICTLLLHPLLRKRLSLRETGLACLLGYASHGLLDACTSYGTQLFWPFSDMRVAWNWISVVDPIFSLPLLAQQAVFQHENTIRVAHGREAVRDHNRSAAHDDTFQRPLNRCFGFVVH